MHVHAAGRAVRVLVAQPPKLLVGDPLPREADPLLEDTAFTGGQAPEETVVVAFHALLAQQLAGDPGREAAKHRVATGLVDVPLVRLQASLMPPASHVLIELCLVDRHRCGLVCTFLICWPDSKHQHCCSCSSVLCS